MGWAARLNKLTLKFHSGSPMDFGEFAPHECLEGEIRNVQYLATRTFLPTIGICYAISFTGSLNGRRHLIRQIQEELGTPFSFECNPSERWLYIWKATVQEIPETHVHKVLGHERINEICSEHSLDDEDKYLVNLYLAILRSTMGSTALREKALMIILKDIAPERISRTFHALHQITNEFAIKSIQLELKPG